MVRYDEARYCLPGIPIASHSSENQKSEKAAAREARLADAEILPRFVALALHV